MKRFLKLEMCVFHVFSSFFGCLHFLVIIHMILFEMCFLGVCFPYSFLGFSLFVYFFPEKCRSFWGERLCCFGRRTRCLDVF